MEKAYDPKKYERDIYNKWSAQTDGKDFFNPDHPIYGKNRKDNKDGSNGYSIVMPPPNVTGTLHMGHASMLAIEDILTRFHRMNGKDTLWLPGTDHAAIATQTKVEKIIKEEGTNRHMLGREKFLDRVRKFAQNSHDTIEGQVKSMGCSCDWSREAYTLDETRHQAVNSVFKLMYEDGLIYRGERIVNWCPRCHSTLADDEVEYKAQKAQLYTFKYGKIIKGKDKGKLFPIAISTTRPETKLGDTAVAVNPKDKRYQEFIGQTFEVDFCGVPLKIKIIADRHIDMEFGTGALGVTPAHSAVDWQMAEENDLKIIKVIDEDGKIRGDFDDYTGLTVSEARQKVVLELEKRDLIEKTEEIENNLSVCYRCDTPIEPLPSLQWFINVNKPVAKFGNKSIKEICIDAVRKGVFGKDKIKIVPERFEKNYFHWMENLKDWCISRQIWFGHQVPVWYRLNSDVAESYNSNPEEFRHVLYGESRIAISTENPGDENDRDYWVQDQDTLDTWFSSGLWTFSTLAHSPEEIKIVEDEDGHKVIQIDNEDFKRFHPTAVLETGYDILFFWVARMIIMTTYAVKDIPFQDVYLHGLVLDEKGKKMSKSKGNVMDPLDMIEKYGTDATRLSLVIGSTPGNDLRLNEEKVAGYRNLVNKIWNIARFITENNQELKDKTQEDSIRFEFKDLRHEDKWILMELNRLIKSTDEDLKKYYFSRAGESLRIFTWEKFADWYLEFSKDEKRPEVLIFVLKTLLKLWHPFIPFVTEQIWQELGGEKLLMTTQWPEVLDFTQQELNAMSQSVELVNDTKEIISAIRNARAENKLEPSKKISAVIYAGEKVIALESQASMIKSLRTGIEKLEIKEFGPAIENEIFVKVGEIEIYLIGGIDKEKEIARLEKEIVSLERVIPGIEKKLSNNAFTQKAPAEVITREKEKLDQWKVRLSEFKAKLKKLK